MNVTDRLGAATRSSSHHVARNGGYVRTYEAGRAEQNDASRMVKKLKLREKRAVIQFRCLLAACRLLCF
jgi:hypothetical protein